MDFEFYFACVFICIVFYLGIVAVTFVDVLSIIMKMVPGKNPKGYDLHKSVMQSDEYKSHRKKWWKRFLFPVIPFAIVLALAMLVLDDLIAFLIAIALSVVIFEIMSKKEKNERKEIEKCIMLKVKNDMEI